MKKKISLLIIILGILGTLTALKIVDLSAKNPIHNNIQATDQKGNKIAEMNMTWGEYIDFYLEENSDVTYYNPRTDISKSREVRVVKTEYPNGLESKAGFYHYALIIQVYDEKTGELLTSAGHYTDKK